LTCVRGTGTSDTEIRGQFDLVKTSPVSDHVAAQSGEKPVATRVDEGEDERLIQGLAAIRALKFWSDSADHFMVLR